MLLVLGAAMPGGLRPPEQHFNPAGARAEATMLTLAAIALILPAAFEAAEGMRDEGLGRPLEEGGASRADRSRMDFA